MKTIWSIFAAVAVTLVLLSPNAAQAQPCLDQPFIIAPTFERPIVERPIVERPIMIRPIMIRPIFERKIIERPSFDQAIFEKAVFDWCNVSDGVNPNANKPSDLLRVSPSSAIDGAKFTPSQATKAAFMRQVRVTPDFFRAPKPTAQTPTPATDPSCCGGTVPAATTRTTLKPTTASATGVPSSASRSLLVRKRIR